MEYTSAQNNNGTVVSNITGQAAADSDTPFLGVAVVAVDNSFGRWEYLDSVNGSWYAIVTSLSSAVLLGPSVRIRFSPLPKFYGNSFLTCYAWDMTSSTTVVTTSDPYSGAFSASPFIASITVTFYDYPPFVNISTSNITIMEGDYIELFPDIVVSDVDNTSLSSATIIFDCTIGGIPFNLNLTNTTLVIMTPSRLFSTLISGDVITVTPLSGGTASTLAFQEYLRSINISSGEDPPFNECMVLVLVHDGIEESNMAEVNVTFELINNNAPKVFLPYNNTMYIEDQPPLQIFSSIPVITDLDSNVIFLMYEASVVLTGQKDSSEGLSIALMNQPTTKLISNNSGNLTVIGQAPVSAYQQILGAIKYYNNNPEPQAGVREVTITVYDGIHWSDPVTLSIVIQLVNDQLPRVSVVNQTVVFKEQGAAVPVATGISVLDLDSGMFLLNSASVTILQPQDGSNESLFMDPVFSNRNVTVMGNNSVSLTFTSPYGGLTYSDATAAIMAVYYLNTAPHVTGAGRTVQIVVYDNLTNIGITPSNPVNISIRYLLLNTPPIVVLNVDLVTYKQGNGSVSLISGAVVTDVSTRGIGGLNISTQGLTSQESITVNTSGSGLQVTTTGHMITINGTASDQVYTNILRTLTYVNTAINVSSGYRTVFITAYGFQETPSNSSLLIIGYMSDPVTFSSTNYNATVPPGAKVGDTVITFQVYHPDTQGVISVLPEIGNRYFKINITDDPTVVVTMAVSECDLGNDPFYVIELVAADVLGRLSSASLTIYQNVNTMAPVFNVSNYTAVINETSDTGTYVLTVHAKDADLGCAGMFEYSALDTQLPFEIDGTTGVITVNGALDFASTKQYIFSVVATDHGFSPLSSTAVINITVANTRDHTPVFNQTSYTVKVCENTTIGSMILGVSATDPDIGTFGQVTYSINTTNGCIGCLFINTTTGIISSSGIFDYEANSFIMATVLALDGGGLANSTSLVIQVLNQNDLIPYFKPLNSTIIIYENFPINTPLPISISQPPLAIDKDGCAVDQCVTGDTTSCPSSVNLTYSITGGNGEGYFTANASTGDIVLVKPLVYDYLQDLIFILTLTVSDAVHSNSTNITVVILDYDACLPVFDQASYNVTIPESSAVGTVVATIHATGCNQSDYILWYSLTPQDDFAIDLVSGNVTVRKSLDHEMLSMYSLVAMVTQPSGDVMANDTVGVALTIVVTHVDESPPLFTNITYYFSVPEGNKVPMVIGTVTAMDGDEDASMDIQYSITGQDLLISFSFMIHDSTGDIVTVAVFDRENISVYNFIVEAVDDGDANLTGYANVSVAVIDVNDNPPVISPTFVNVTFPENVANGTIVANFTITDADLGSNAAYHVTILGGTHFVFSTTSSGGLLLVEGVLDYEQQPVITLTVLVQNTAPPYYITNATVVINLINLNDNPAVVTGTPISLDYFEGDYSLDLSLDFTVTDADIPYLTPILSGQVSFVNYNPSEPSYPFVPGNSRPSSYTPLACSLQDEESKFKGCGVPVMNILTTESYLTPPTTVINGTLSLDSSKGQYAKYNRQVTIQSNQNVTFAMWVWYMPTNTFPQTIFAKTSLTQVVYGAACNSNGSLTFTYISQFTRNVTLPNVCNLISNSWHHLTIVVINSASNSMVEVYIDGGIQGAQSIALSSDKAGEWYIGALYMTSALKPQNYFNGRIHFFTISTSAVEEDNIQCAIGCGVSLVSSLNRYQTPLTYHYDYISRTLVVSGSGSFVDYELFFNSLVWVQPFIPVQEPWYFLNYTVDDNSSFMGVHRHGQPFTLGITVLATNRYPPVLLLNGIYGANYTATFTEQMGPVSIVNTSSFFLVDSDVSNEYVITVTIHGVEQPVQEILSVSNIPAGIGASYDTSTNTLTLVTLNGPQPISLFAAVLQSITYDNTADEITGLYRTVEFNLDDPPFDIVNAFTNILLIMVDDQPLLKVAPTLTQYTEGDGVVNLIGSTNITDIDNTTLVSANITFFAPDGGDVELLNVTTTGTAITATYIHSISTLLLRGEDTLQNYSNVISSLTYVNTYLNNPIPLTRVFTISVFDGIKSSNLVNISLQFIAVNNPPVLNLGKPDMLTFMEDITQNITLVMGNVTLTDIDNTTLTSITVTLLDIPDGLEESIIYVEGPLSNIITATSYGSKKVIRLTPASATSGTLQSFRMALSFLVYQNRAPEVTGGVRRIQFVANDGLNNALPAYINISVLLPPTIITANGYQTNYTEKGPAVYITSRSVNVSDLDSASISYVSVTIFNASDTKTRDEVIRYSNTSDLISAITTWNGSITQYLFHVNNISLLAAGQFLENLTYINTKPKPTIGPRQVNISVSDWSGGWSQAVTSYITVYDTNDYAPQFTNYTYNAGVYEDLSPSASVTTVLATDLDMGTNGLVVYGIVTSQDSFVIDPMSGLISTNKTLDRESISSYTLNVSAHDLGVPQMFSYTMVYIQVIDVNDNPPVISPPFVNVTFPENVANGTIVANFTITDADIGSNAENNVTILGGTQFNFSSTSSGGLLLVEGVLDYEQQPVITLTVLVQNTAPSYYITNATVVINLINLNDNPAVVTGVSNYLYYEGVSLLLLSQFPIMVNDRDGCGLTPILSGQVSFVNYNPSEPSYPFVPGNSSSFYTPLACSLQDEESKFIGCGFSGFDNVLYIVTTQGNLMPSIPLVNGTLSLNSSKGQYVRYTSQVTIQSNQNVTFAMWVWYMPTNTFPQTIFAKTSLTQVVYGAACNSNGSLTFMYFSQFTRNVTLPNVCNLISNSWHHLTIVVINSASNSMVEVYIDGKFVIVQNIMSSTDTGGWWYIGALYFTSASKALNYFNGRIHFFTISASAVEEDNIQCAIGCGVSLVSSLNRYQTPLTYHYDYINRTLLVSGSGSCVDYETFFNSLVWVQPFIPVQEPWYFLNYTVDDNSSFMGVHLHGQPFTPTIVVIANYLSSPVLLLNGIYGTNYTTTFTEQMGPVSIVNTSSFFLVDSDVSHEYVITVTIHGVEQPVQEILSVSNVPAGIGASYDNSTNTLTLVTLNGPQPISLFAAVLQSITYVNTADEITGLYRTVEFNVNSLQAFYDVSVSAFTTILLIMVDDPAVLMVTSRLTQYTEGDGIVSLIGSTNITDIDNTTLVSANITFFAPDGGDVELLNVATTGTAITATYIHSISTLLLQGEDTLQNYSSVIHSLTYVNTYLNNPIPLTRVFTISVFDGIKSSNLVNISLRFIAVNNPPVLNLGKPDMLTFMEDITQNITLVMGNVILTDIDNTTLASITVTLLDNPDGSEESIICGPLSNIITATSYGSKKVILTPASGTSGTLQSFKIALMFLVYQNLAPEVTEGVRRVQFVASDGLNNAAPAYINVSISLPPALITASGYQTTYTEKGPAVYITSRNVNVSDLEPVFISYVSVTIFNAYDTNTRDEVIRYSNTSDLISAITTWNGSITQYLFHVNNISLLAAGQFLEDLTYINTKPKPTIGVREVNISVSDWSGGWSQAVTSYITVYDTNDYAPQFTKATYNAGVNEDLSPSASVTTVLATDLDMGTNGLVVYGIVTSQDSFVIDPMSGLISTNKALDRESISSYTLNVSAHDLGVPQMFSYTTVYVQVIDVNDNPPVISPPFVSVTFPENVANGTIVANFTITDADIGSNAAYHVTILGGTQFNFSTTSSGGLLLVEGVLDYEQQPVITLTVLVQNTAPPHYITTYDITNATIVIILVNLNDNPAMVTASTTTVYFNEGDGSAPLDIGVHIADPDGRDFTSILSGNLKFVNFNEQEESFQFTPNSNYLPHDCLQDDLVKFASCGFFTPSVLTRAVQATPPSVVVGGDLLAFNASGMQYAVYSSYVEKITSTAPNATFSVWLWMVPKTSKLPQTIFARANQQGTVYAGAVCFYNGTLQFLYYSNRSQQSVMFGDVCNTISNAWHHLAIVVINTAQTPMVQVYIDGRFFDRKYILPLIDGSSWVTFGARPLALNRLTDYFNGKMYLFVTSTSAAEENNIQCAIGCGVSIVSSMKSYQTPLKYRYDYSTRSLSVSGSGTFSVYEDFFNSLIWTQPFEYPETLYYTADYTVDDNSSAAVGAVPLTVTIVVQIVNNYPPVLELDGSNGVNYTAYYFQAQGPVPVVNVTTFSLTDKDMVANDYTVTVTIVDTQEQNGQEVLSVYNVPKRMMVFTNYSTTITLSGPFKASEFKSVISTITYNNLAIQPVGFSRTIRFDIQDPPSSNISAFTTIFIIYVDYTPELRVTPSLTQYTEGDGVVSLIGSTNITDIDNTTLVSANITFFAPDGGDVELLNVTTTGTAITATYIHSISTLLLQGEDTLQNYSNVISSLTYVNTYLNNPIPLTRVFTISVFDGIKSSNLVNISLRFIAVNNPPVLNLGKPDMLTFMEDISQNITLVMGNVILTDVDNTTLASITVTLLDNPDGLEESIIYVEGQLSNIITATSYGSKKVILTPASGTSGTLQSFKIALMFLVYQNLAPEVTEGVRRVQFVASDGLNNAAPAYINVSISLPPALITASGYQTTYTEKGPAVYITSRNVNVSDLEPVFISYVNVTIFNAYDTNTRDEVIGYSNSSDLISTTIMTWNGSITQYLFHVNNISLLAAGQFLEDLTYINTKPKPTIGVREVNISVSDWSGGWSQAVTSYITVYDTNDYAPQFTKATYNAGVYEDLSPSASVTTVLATDLDMATNGLVVYGIVTSQDSFVIDPMSGLISTNKTLDRESISSYTLNVSAHDLGVPQMFSYTMVYIQVIDVNDNPPVISPPFVNVTFPENVANGTIVANFTVTDADLGSNAAYHVTILGGTHFVFSSTSSGGLLLVEGVLDYEQQPVITLTVLVQNTAPPHYITNATVVINLINLNDNPAVVVASSSHTYYYQGDDSAALNVGIQIADADGRDFTSILSGKLQFVNFNEQEQSFPFTPNSNYLPHDCLQDDLVKFRSCGFFTPSVLTRAVQATPPSVVVGGDLLAFNASRKQYAVYTGSTQTLLSGSSITFSVWIWLIPATNTLPQTIFVRTSPIQGPMVFMGALCHFNGTLEFLYSSQNVQRSAVFSGLCTMVTNAWHHLAIVVINTAQSPMVQVYVDGSLSATQSISLLSDMSALITMGATRRNSSTLTNYFNGKLYFFTISYTAAEGNNIQCAIGCGVSIVSSMKSYQTPLKYRYDYSTRSLSVSGSGTFSVYEDFFNSLIWTQPFEYPETQFYMISYAVEDNSSTTLPAAEDFTLTVEVIPLDVYPSVLALNGYNGVNYTTNFTEAAGPIPVVNTSSFSLTNKDHLPNTYLATIAILDPLQPAEEEVLNISSVPPGMTVIREPYTLMLTGFFTISTFQTVLKNVTYNNMALIPTGFIRTLRFDVLASARSTLANHITPMDSNFAFTTVFIVYVDYTPELMVTPSLTQYTEGDGVVNLIGSTNITDIDNTTLVSANITFFAPDGGDVELLNVTTTGTAITATYIHSIPTLLLQGEDTLQNYSNVISSLTYVNTYLNNPIPLTRVFTISVFDGIKSSNLVNISLRFIAVNNPPVLNLGKPDMLTFMEDITQNITLVMGNIILTDVDNTTLASITVTLLDNPDGLDESIIYVEGPLSNIITATSYGSKKVILTPASGTSGTLQSFKIALMFLVYQNLAPEVTEGVRRVQFVASDGLNNAAPAYINVSISLPPALITASGYQTTYTEKGPAVYITSRNVNVSDLEPVFISYVSVTIFNAYDTNTQDEVIGYSNTSDLISTTIMTWNGSITQYLFHVKNLSLLAAGQFLEDLTYINTKPKPTIGVREVNISVSDWSGGWSQAVTSYITVYDTNDYAPQFTKATYNAGVNEDLSPSASVTTVLATDLDMGTNGLVVYGIVTSQDSFVIDPMSGLISTNKALDRESISSYTLNVSAHDLGVPQMFSYTTVYVQVIDVNDNPPVISPPFVSVTFPENVANGTIVANFTITDADIGSNAAYHVTILGGTHFVFSSTSSGGLLLVEGVLNYEQQPVITLTVLVQNTAPPYYITNATVVINLINLNDNPAVVTGTPNSLDYFEGDYSLDLSLNLTITDADGRDFVPISAAKVELVDYDPNEPSFPFTPNTELWYLPQICSLQSEQNKFFGCGLSDIIVLTDTSSSFINTYPPGTVVVGNSTVFLDASRNQYVEYTQQLPKVTSTATLALWVWLVPISNTSQTLFAKVTASSTILIGALCRPDGSLEFFYASNNLQKSITFNSICTRIANSWHHLAFVLQSPVVQVYIDGTLVTQQAISSLSDGQGRLFIGARPQTTLSQPRKDFFNGQIHFFTISTLAVQENNIQCAIGCGMSLISSLNRYQTPLTYRYDYINRNLYISGNASFAVYETFLKSLIWVQPFTVVRRTAYTLNYTADNKYIAPPDQTLTNLAFQLTLNVILENTGSPTLNLNGAYGVNYTTTMTQLQGPVPAVNTTTFSLTDRDLISSQYIATVVIMDPQQPIGQEILAVTDVSSSQVVSSYDNSTYTLTISGGPLSISAIEAVLRTVTYNNTATLPLGLSRTLRFDVQDLPLLSNPAFTTIFIIHIDYAPVLMVTPRLTHYTAGDGVVNLIGSTNITDIDNTTLVSANITFFAPDGGDVELLNVTTTGTAITATYIHSISTLLLQGEDTLQNYSNVISSLTYVNTNKYNPTPLLRAFTISVFDRIKSSNLVNISLNLTSLYYPIFIKAATTSLVLIEGSDTLSIGQLSNITLILADTQASVISLTISLDGTLESQQEVLLLQDANGLTQSVKSGAPYILNSSLSIASSQVQ